MTGTPARVAPRVTFEIAVVVAYVIFGGAFFHDPSSITRTAVGQVLHPFTYVWCAFYVLGGLTYLAGLWISPLWRIRDAALCLLVAGWAMNACAIVYAQGADPRAGIPAVFAAAGVLVALDLRRARRQR